MPNRLARNSIIALSVADISRYYVPLLVVLDESWDMNLM
tara:strand:+ start:316 stop:432 length:117 start_codon:yes stop_codon:yes gene_type:complete